MNAPTSPLTFRRPVGDLVREDRVHTSLYTDPGVFDQEMDRIFRNCWVWVAHASELPEAGSYKTHWVGMEPVIVVRDRKQQLHVMLNRCRHRAATVCEHKKGKTASFVCPYHGWAYALDGSLRGVPHPESYGDCVDKGEFPLVKLRVAQYNGMIFATFSDAIPSLEEWLGPAKKWIDLFMKQGAGYPVKIAGEHRFRFPGNWKIQLENTTDAYHFPLVHKSFLSTVDPQTERMLDFVGGPGYVEDLGNGHSVMVMIPELVDLEADLDNPSPSASKTGPEPCAMKARRPCRAPHRPGRRWLRLQPQPVPQRRLLDGVLPRAAAGLGDRDRDPPLGHHHGRRPGGGQPAPPAPARTLPGPDGLWHTRRLGGLGARAKGLQRGQGPVDHAQPRPARRARDPDGRAGDVSAETGMRAAYQQWKKLMTA